MVGIYKIINPKGKIYIGQSVDINIRFNDYKSLYKFKKQIKLYNSIKKYGYENHLFEIIEECLESKLNERERYWQEFYDVINRNRGLNLKLTKTNDKSGKLSIESKLKIGNSNRGKKRTDEQKIKIGLSGQGKKRSISIKNKMKLSNLGRKATSAQKQNMIDASTNSKLVLHLQTGIYYSSARQASIAYNYQQSYLSSMLNGRYKNKTDMIYV